LLPVKVEPATASRSWQARTLRLATAASASTCRAFDDAPPDWQTLAQVAAFVFRGVAIFCVGLAATSWSPMASGRSLSASFPAGHPAHAAMLHDDEPEADVP
jgi:hypothetical protein